jgi:hypothetical protein
MNLDDEVLKILDSIKIKDIKSMKEIEIKNNEIVDIVYENFMKYKNNEKNKEETKNKLKDYGYEYIDDVDDLINYDFISILNLNEFYDLQLKFSGYFMKKKDNNKLLIKKYNNFFWYLDINKTILFRKIRVKNKVKMLLIDTINNIE